MANRLICVVLFVLALATMIFSTAHMLDPLFLFLSDNPITGGIRLAIVASLLAVSFTRRALKPPFRAFIKAFSIFLVVFGITSLFSNSMGWALYDYVMPLDSLLMVEAGIMFGLAILTTSEANIRKAAKKIQKGHSLTE